MSSNVQPIVCCIGYPVAGNPTQFLMQRANATLGLDWIFLTAEVKPDCLTAAFQGIRALNFSGLAILRPHQKTAMLLVDSMTEAATRSGHVRVARRDGDCWLGDDTIGQAIVYLLTTSVPTRGAERIASDVRGYRGILCAGVPWLPHLLRLANPLWSDRIFYFDTERDEVIRVGATENNAPANATSVDREIAATTEKSVTKNFPTAGSESSIAVDSAVTAIDAIIIDTSSPKVTAKQLAKMLKFEDHDPRKFDVVFVQPNADWENAIRELRLDVARVYRSFDINAAKAVVNYLFWTGHSVELATVRDSLDEYCQW